MLVSLMSPWQGCYVDQAGLKLLDLPASTFRVLRLKAHVIILPLPPIQEILKINIVV